MRTPSIARRVKPRLTYANVIATLALFIALGGVSYAATKLPKNSVSSKAIKKNAVTNPKIKRSAVTGSKIKNGTITGVDVAADSLTGEKINESTLAVPSAATAADSFNLVKLTSSSAANSIEAQARAAATPVLLVSHGHVSVYAKCFKVSPPSGQTNFELYAATDADGAAMDGYSITDSNYEPPLNTSTVETDRAVARSDTNAPPDLDSYVASDVSLLGPDGRGLFFSAITYGRAGNPPSSPGFLPADGSCAFHLSGFKVG